MEKLNNVIDKIVAGDWGKEDTDNIGVKVIRTTNFTNTGKIDYSNIVTRIISDKKITERMLQPNDIIIEKSGGSPNQPVGRVVFFENNDNNVYLCNNFTSVIRCKNNVDSKYIFYYLYLNWCRGGTKPFQNKTTGILNLKLEQYLDSINISLPSLAEQQKIVAILDKADEIRTKKKLANDKLDEFLKSTFIDMFGDPVKNDKNYSLWSLKDVCTKITDGTHDTPKRYDAGIMIITGKNIKPFRIDYSQIDYVSESDHKIIYARCNPEYGDILYTNIGVNLGTAVMNNVYDEFSMKNVALLKHNREILTSRYLEHLMNFVSIKDEIIRISSIGGAQKFLSLSQIKEFKIPVPPIELQNKFAKIVEHVEAQKQKNEQVIEQMNNLFNSLSQKAFKGEL